MLAVVLSAFFSAYGLIVLVEYLGIPLLSLEERLFPDLPKLGAIPTGRMSPTTAMLLILSGTVAPMLFLRDRGGERRKIFGDLAGCLGGFVAVTGAVFVLSYLHGVPLLYGTSTIPMAATTALAFLLLGTGQVLVVGPDGFPSKLFAGPSTRARLLRVFVSTTVGVVVAIDLLRVYVYAHRIFHEGNAFVSGVFTMALVIVTGALIARVAFKVGNDLDRSEEFRRRAEDKLRESEDRFRDLVEHSQELICTHDLEGRILSANPWAATVLGIAPEELLRMNFRDLLVPEVRHEFERYLGEMRTHGSARGMMWVQTRKGERLLWEYKNTLRTEGVAEPIVRGMAQDITERKRAEEALRASQKMIEDIINAIPVRVFWKGRNLVYLGCNSVFARDAGFADPKDVIGKDDFQMGWREQAELYRADDRLVIESGCSKFLMEELQTTPEGNTLALLTSKIPLRNSNGEIKGVLGTYYDITDLKSAEAEKEKLQSQLLQAQKMEAVGRLAGGVAHDFNNLLTVITGYSELLLQKVGKESDIFRDVEEIKRAGERAAALTQQLLAFSRKQVIEPKVLDLNLLMANLGKMLVRLIGENIHLEMVSGKDLGWVKVDPGQFEQVLINLAVNARDAMPDGGTLIIETANVELNEEYCAQRPYEIHPGWFVRLAVSDTGHGMTKETSEHIFEPFFTTKEKGKGTGLGLSMIYGAVKQSGGSIEVYSEAGTGTTFKIYLPMVESDDSEPRESRLAVELPTGSETLLLVEDEDVVRGLAVRILGDLGYRVMQARNGDEAIAMAKKYSDRIDLLLTDVVMPGMSGAELAKQLAPHHPEMKVLFTSGYTDDAISRHGVLDEGVSFIGKPYTPSALARKVREVLDEHLSQ